MQIRTTPHFDRSYAKAPPAIKRAFLKQVAFLLEDIRHPSLRAKKYDAERWQVRVTRDWRLGVDHILRDEFGGDAHGNGL